MEYGYLVVEGYHEVEFVGRLLKNRSLKRISKRVALDEFWARIANVNYPPDGDIVKRVPIPAFFQNNEYSIAVQSAIGLSQLLRTLVATLMNHDVLLQDAVGIGIVLDADYDQGGANVRFMQLKNDVERSSPLTMPDEPGNVRKGPPNSGIFIFPDNGNNGTLETILLECAEVAYPNLLTGARTFIHQVNLDELKSEDKKDLVKPFGRDKATLGCVGNVLRPGKAIQVSIQDNRWVSRETLRLPKIIAFKKFLTELFNLH